MLSTPRNGRQQTVVAGRVGVTAVVARRGRRPRDGLLTEVLDTYIVVYVMIVPAAGVPRPARMASLHLTPGGLSAVRGSRRTACAAPACRSSSWRCHADQP